MWYSSDSNSPDSHSPEEIVARCQQVMAHAWMVRTFVKHSDEAEDFPEIMGIARMVFDLSLALESRLENPQDYFRMLRKKIGKLRTAVEQFEQDAPVASTHTNFQQAVESIKTCHGDLVELLALGKAALEEKVTPEE